MGEYRLTKADAERWHGSKKQMHDYAEILRARALSVTDVQSDSLKVMAQEDEVKKILQSRGRRSPN